MLAKIILPQCATWNCFIWRSAWMKTPPTNFPSLVLSSSVSFLPRVCFLGKISTRREKKKVIVWIQEKSWAGNSAFLFFLKVWFESFHSSPVGYLLPLMSFLASPVSDAQHERKRSLSKRNRNGKIRRCQECQGQQKFTSFKFTPMWELEINLRQSMWVHSLLYSPATQAVFPGVEPMEWGWRWGER